MAQRFRRLQRQVAKRRPERTRWVRDRDAITMIAGALYELNGFHVKRLCGKPESELTEDDKSFLEYAEQYRKELEQWLDSAK